MLAGFNESHQHCVLTGAARRFSSTHRVADARGRRPAPPRDEPDRPDAAAFDQSGPTGQTCLRRGARSAGGRRGRTALADIAARCAGALAGVAGALPGAAALREALAAHTALEGEWLRQYYFQARPTAYVICITACIYIYIYIYNHLQDTYITPPRSTGSKAAPGTRGPTTPAPRRNGSRG